MNKYTLGHWTNTELFMFLDHPVLPRENAQLIADELISRGYPIDTIKHRLDESNRFRN